MDEPFGALDAIERTRLQSELAELQRHLAKTVLFVTHDVDEALRLADTIVIMRSGTVVQADRPHNILAAPADDFVAQLMNSNDLVRRMTVLCARDALAPREPALGTAHGPAISASADLRSAFSQLLLSGYDCAPVVEGETDHRLADDRERAAGRSHPARGPLKWSISSITWAWSRA